MRFALGAALAAAVGVWCCAEVGAAIIAQVNPSTSLADSTWSATDEPSDVKIDLVTNFKDPAMLGSPLMLKFTLEANDVGKPIWLVHGAGGTEAQNNTGPAWNGFDMLLVNVSSVLPQYAGAGFDTTKTITSDKFSSVSVVADRIEFTGGTVANGTAVQFSNIWITHSGEAGDVFYLKQIPVPEPATLAVIALGGLGVLARRNRR
jgi:hypothetical protein